VLNRATTEAFENGAVAARRAFSQWFAGWPSYRRQPRTGASVGVWREKKKVALLAAIFYQSRGAYFVSNLAASMAK
jgi:hypothetical protein